MRVLLLHSHYQRFGGEDQVFLNEADLLESSGHEVLRYVTHNKQVGTSPSPALAIRAVWNTRVYADIRALCRSARPDVAHFHNTLPLISPAAYYAARAEGVPVVQTLHNYRIACPAATLFRDGHVCEQCVGRRVAIPAVRHRCYRGSLGASATVAALNVTHRALGTWQSAVDCYVTLTEFARRIYVTAGLPEHRLVRKPHFVYPAPSTGLRRGGYALFVGRLSPEKGVRTLVAAWEQLGGTIPLKVVGTGPLEGELNRGQSNIEFLGQRDRDGVISAMQDASFLVFPSECYETFGLAVIEAFACGIPVICSNGGAHTELVADGVSGLHFHSGSPEDLVRAVTWLIERPAAAARMASAARREFESYYSADVNYQQLLQIYERAQVEFSRSR